jgi:phosphoenolpyruvate carboxylase
MPRERRTDVVFAEKDKSLRDDVHLLGALVGELVEEQGGQSLYELVETARRASIDRRESVEGAEARLVGLVDAMKAVTAREFTRAFSTYFQMVNTAERVHRIRRRRDYSNDPDNPQPHGFEHTVRELRAAGHTLEQLAEVLGRIRIEPVFTAHPTEPTRRTILRKQQNIVRQMVAMLDPSMTPAEQRAGRAVIRMEITTGWQTEEHPGERMTVADELEHVLFFMTDVVYAMLPHFYESLEHALGEGWGEAAESVPIPHFLHFGSWVGGDMDGNPEVTAKTIRETLARQRALILNLYYEECAALARRLSQSESRIEVSAELRERAESYAGHFPHAMHEVPIRHRDMPYRVFLRLVMERLQATFDDTAFPYESAAEFIDDVELLAESLREHRGQHAGLFSVERLLRRARTFGFHLLTLDVRQDARVHREVIGEALGDPDWTSRKPGERVRRLVQALENRELPREELSSNARKTLAVFQAIAFCRRKYGRHAIGPYVISMTQGPDDLLSVLLLARWGELGRKSGAVPLDVVPLFETVDDLDAGPDVMRQVLELPLYREHLASRDGRQMVMVGFSDSNKDGGLAAARWAVHRAQQALVESMDEGIELTLFQGRGGTVARGGGHTHAAVLASPPGAIAGRLRVTEQGESINAKYGLRAIATRTLERTWSALVNAELAPRRRSGREAEWAEVMNTIADASRDRYKRLVYGDHRFADYFRAATPVDVIEQMRIGSRPPSRRQGVGIENLRAIPWVFAWTQSRFFLPAWFGIGTGLAAAIDKHGEAIVADMASDWYFLATLLEDVETVLAKADIDIARRYSELAGDLHDRFFPIVRQEYDASVEHVLRLKRRSVLLEDDATLRRAILLRNPYMDPVSFLQVDLLKRWRAANREDDALFRALLASVNAIAHGLQSTG